MTGNGDKAHGRGDLTNGGERGRLETSCYGSKGEMSVDRTLSLLFVCCVLMVAILIDARILKTRGISPLHNIQLAKRRNLRLHIKT